MFVIELIYKVDLAQIDRHMTAHVKFLKKYYASGHFLVSGRKIPRDIQQDPFHSHGLADFRIIEFRASQRADDIDRRIGAR